MTDADTTDVDQLAVRLDHLTADVARLTADVEDLAAAVLPPAFDLPNDDTTAGPPNPATDTDGVDRQRAGPEPAYATLRDWVDGYFRPTFPRPVGGEIRWCTRWPDHAEALTRLEALWRSWEALRLDPNLGIATWLTTYLDPLHTVLLSRAGPFASCTPDRHTPSPTEGPPR
jgi:hypothetical protein